MRAALALGGLLGLSGCPIPQSRFADQLAQAACERAEACDALGGVDLEDCLVTTAAHVERSILVADCDYSESEARACVTSVENVPCAELLDGADALAGCDTTCAGG
jgi:hypothetical protein